MDDSYVPLHEDGWENDNVIWYTLVIQALVLVFKIMDYQKLKQNIFFI